MPPPADGDAPRNDGSGSWEQLPAEKRGESSTGAVEGRLDGVGRAIEHAADLLDGDDLGAAAENRLIIPASVSVLEFKANDRVPYRLTDLAARAELSVVRLSKYCLSVEAFDRAPRSIFHIPDYDVEHDTAADHDINAFSTSDTAGSRAGTVALQAVADVEVLLEVVAEREVEERAPVRGQLHRRRQAPLDDRQVAGGEHLHVVADVGDGLIGPLGQPADRGGAVDLDHVHQPAAQRMRQGGQHGRIGDLPHGGLLFLLHAPSVT